jgi:plastocyanin
MKSKVVKVLVGFLVTGALVLGASVALAETFGVRATMERRWQPAHRFITRGDRIKWRNTTQLRHNIKSYGGNWSFFRRLPAGTSRSRQFNSTGVFRFRCKIHSTITNGACSGMCGIIHVEQ